MQNGINTFNMENKKYDLEDALPEPEMAFFPADTFSDILTEMLEIHKVKNSDYGNSFEKSIDKYGLIAALTRMSDKFCRAENLILKGTSVGEVKDERLEDTLLDLANYCVMTLAYIRDNKEFQDGVSNNMGC